MKAKVQINPGICGFSTTVIAESEDGQDVIFEIQTGCQTIKELEQQILEIEPVDAIMSLGPEENSILQIGRNILQTKGCCDACVVPAGVVKAMQVATNLALPKEVSMSIEVLPE